jgi:hypothetical protein
LQDRLRDAEQTLTTEKARCCDLAATVDSLLATNANELAKNEVLSNQLAELRVLVDVEKLHSTSSER